MRLGIDIGSTTAKLVVLNEDGSVAFSAYKRHNARAEELLIEYLETLLSQYGDASVSLSMTGSVGMGIAERCSLRFVQEVVAAAKAIGESYPSTRTMIDIGGEDAKVVFFENGKTTDLRMNGNCAGGTGAFIDQMAILLGVSTDELDVLARSAHTVHPIASRCGVFSKTDVQNLIAKNVSKEDIAASVFHAVAVQVVVTLAHGCDIKSPLLLCGGPLTFLPELRRAFAEYLKLSDKDIIVPTDSHLIPALGAAISASEDDAMPLSKLIDDIRNGLNSKHETASGLSPIFVDEDDYKAWRNRIESHNIKEVKLSQGKTKAVLGIDSGSTTTKIVALNERGELLFHYYHNNEGNPIEAARRGLRLFDEQCKASGADVEIVSSCSTGYGEDLLKASFRLDHGIIETIAHYMAARNLAPRLSFILDIGGQDMKAIFVDEGIINRMEINEACSSGCGSFIETFARSLGYSVDDFAKQACRATKPYDLGTRCTVFMNSKVKQALREGASIADIAAGLSYSVVKNCLYKVLRLKNTKDLGASIVVQGGTMKNDSVVRAFERLTGREVFRPDHPELMGAIGCALYAAQNIGNSTTIEQLLANSDYTTRQQQCHGCENNCLVSVYRFDTGNRYFSGNRCEKVFVNKGKKVEPGINTYTFKRTLLFDREYKVDAPIMRLGIARSLNMYEEYPFWHTLFTRSGIDVVLSEPSSFSHYELCAKQVMSDNICFPAKLVHSHVRNVVEKGVDRIFMPFVVYEKMDGGQNSYNCPIVSGYTEVVKGEGSFATPIDSPTITFKDVRLLRKQCLDYLQSLGVPTKRAKSAFDEAVNEMQKYEDELARYNRQVLETVQNDSGKLTILLAGRPYHTDPLIQHKLSDVVAGMGVNVITEDIVRGLDVPTDDTNFVSQWSFTNRILKAAKWAALQGEHIQFMQMTSFGCGPDAFLTDETRSLLQRYGKTLTLLKIDDVSNIGSLTLRVRSLIESLRLSTHERGQKETAPFLRTPIFTKQDRRRKIIAPFFTPFISPLIPPMMKLAGYDMENLPISDSDSADYGLRFANNEVCYPATLIVGDIVKAFRSGRYSPETTAVAITQTGGQCRASNYISLIKKALTESGFGDVPVVSLATGSGLENEQPGFRINWLRWLPMVITALVYSDSLAKMYYASVVRECEKGTASALLKRYLDLAVSTIERNKKDELWTLLASAAKDFDRITVDKKLPRVGIVGEIYLKFNPFAQKDITSWLCEQGIEVVPPMLTDFFLQSFVNTEVNHKTQLERKQLPDSVLHFAYRLVWKQLRKAAEQCAAFRYFEPFESIYDKAKEAEQVVSLTAQFGEGWLLPGEIMSMARQGVNHVISLQPFGCIANHIVAKGIEKRIKAVCPQMNLLTLDFDSGVSDVNIRNRVLLFIDNISNQAQWKPRTMTVWKQKSSRTQRNYSSKKALLKQA